MRAGESLGESNMAHCKQKNKQTQMKRGTLPQYAVSDSKREQFRSYLEKAGVLESITNVLVALYGETEKPNNALDFMKHQLGVGPKAEDAESQLKTLKQKCDQLMEENKELRSRLLQYKLAPDGGTE